MNEICFKGPYTFLRYGGLSSIFESDIGKERGIYIWTVPFKDKELIYYIGMTASQTFSRRLTQHLKGYLSGEYGINDPIELQRGERVRIWDGLWRGANIKEFIQKHSLLFPKLLKLLKTFRIYMASLDDEPRYIERAEAAIAKHLYDQEGIIGNFPEVEIRYNERRENENPIMVGLEYNNKIIGLPQKIEI